MNNEVVNIKDVDVVRCSNCEKHLMNIVPGNLNDEVLYTLQVTCPWCNDHSYDYAVRGPLKYHFVQGVKFKDSVEKGKKLTFITSK